MQLVYRPQDDPLIHDEGSQERELYLAPYTGAQAGPSHGNSGFTIADLEDGIDFDNLRENEGEAANHGIFYDDTSYDYMQHLREIQPDGSNPGCTVPALEDALRMSSLDERHRQSSPKLPSSCGEGLSSYSTQPVRKVTYQNMQNVPDEIAGFQPGMDPRLREALEALEDDAYVDDHADEDTFGALMQGGGASELDLDDFEETYDEVEDEGWESDVTEKAREQVGDGQASTLGGKGGLAASHGISTAEAEAASAEDGDWLRDFAKSKRSPAMHRPAKPCDQASVIPASEMQAPASTLYTLGGTPLRQKRRKGALTNPSAYSMTSSSLARTDGQRLLDDRFARIEESYAPAEADELCGELDGDGGVSIASGLSRRTTASIVSTRSFADGPVRSDLDGMMDEFLDGWSKNHLGGSKKNGTHSRRGKDGNEKLSMKMLDEVRQDLGPARYKVQKA